VRVPEGQLWRFVLTNRSAWLLMFARMLSDPVWYFYLFWFPKYLMDARGRTLAEVGKIAWIVYLAADLGSIIGGWCSGPLIRRGMKPIPARIRVMTVAALIAPAGCLIGFGVVETRAASPLAPPHSLEAARRGLNVLIDFKDIEAFPSRVIAVRRSFLEKNRETVKRFLKAYSEAVYQFNNDKKLGIATYAKWLKEENAKVNEETYDYFRTLLSFPPRAVRGQGFRTGIQMIAQRLGRGTTDINLEQFLDESLLDELEKEGFYKLITK